MPDDIYAEVPTGDAAPEPRNEHVNVETGEGPGIDTGQTHPFGTDTHPMHEWDADTRAGVRGWHETLRSETHSPRLEAAAALLQDVEARLAAGDPVGQRERGAVNDEYRAAIAEHEHNEGKLRTLAVRTPDSFDQSWTGEPIRDGWRIGEEQREAQIAQLNAAAAASAPHLAARTPPAADAFIDTTGAGMPAVLSAEPPAPEPTPEA